MQRLIGNRATAAAVASHLSVSEQREMGQAFGVDLTPVRVFRDSALPARLGAQALARGNEIHLSPGSGPPSRHLLAHEVAHLIQQHERPVTPTTMVGGIPVCTDPELEAAADASARRPPGRDSRSAQRGRVDLDADPVGEVTAQLWPPRNLEEAEKELTEVEGKLFGRSIVVYWTARETRQTSTHRVELRAPGGMRQMLAAALPQITAVEGIDRDTATALIQLWLALRGWKEDAFRRQAGFGYSQVSAAYFAPPTPLQTEFSFNPFRPELHGRPLDAVSPSQTLETLGSDLVVRDIDAANLADQRARSQAYRPPSSADTYSAPTYTPEIYQGQSTELTPERVGTWASQKRGKPATTGSQAHSGGNWPSQQSVMHIGAADAVASFNARQPKPVLREDVPYEWLHMFAFSMGGLDAQNPQDPRNFVVGTQYANYYHEIFEGIAKELAKTRSIRVRCEALEPISADWRLYAKLRYSFWIPETFPVRIVTRDIPCFGTPQVHVGDKDGLKQQILAELGLATAKYLDAAEKAFADAAAANPLFSLEPMRGGFADEIVPTDEDPDLQMTLVQSVLEIAQTHGVTAQFEVGYADGRDRNCSILSIFAAAGVNLSARQAAQYREELEQIIAGEHGDIDLTEHGAARAAFILEFLRDNHGKDCTLRVLRPQGSGFAITDLAGDGDMVIYVFYANNHFSPARPNRH